MRTNITRPFACQGDIFRSVPLADVLMEDGKAKADPGIFAPALLVSHDCTMAKRVGKTLDPKIRRIQWLPLHDLADEDPARQGLARKRDLAPHELVYLGEVQGLGFEAFGLLGELMSLPAALVEPTIGKFEGHEEADPDDPHHIVFGRHGECVASLDEDEMWLLYRKMALFWMGADLEPSDDTPQLKFPK